jgi:hypothetical protein
MSEQQWRVDGAERWEWLTFDFEQGAVRVRCGDTFNQSGDDGRTLTREEVIALRDKLSEWIGDDVVANMWCRCGWRVRRVAAFRCSSCGITPLLEEPDGADDPRDVIPLKQQIGAYMKKYGTTEREARRDVDFFRSRMDPEDRSRRICREPNRPHQRTLPADEGRGRVFVKCDGYLFYDLDDPGPPPPDAEYSVFRVRLLRAARRESRDGRGRNAHGLSSR